MAKLLGRVLVGGGSGFIGSHLNRVLTNIGYEVTVISRMPGPKRMTWHDIKSVGIPEDTRAVVNLAGQNVLDMSGRWTEGFKQNVFNSRVETTTQLAKAIEESTSKPTVSVTVTGVGIYKPCEHTVYTESSPTCEFDFFSKLCVEWENAAKLPADVNTRPVIIRSGVVIGSDGGMIKQLYLPFYLGLGGPVMPGSQFLPWIHIDDITRLICFAIQGTNITGVLNGVAPQCITNKQFSEAFAKALYRPSLFPVPKFVLDALLNEERAKMLTTGQHVSPQRTQSLGFQFLYPTIQGACDEVTRTPKVKEL